jgi:zinc/manganese transport system substrate-binding protein
MTRTLITLLVLLAASRPGVAADRLRLVATTADLGAIAAAVGGDAVEVTTLARPTEDPHFVDPKPSFIRILNQADALVEGGAALEAGWLPPLLDAARNPKIATGQPGRVVAASGIALRDVPTQLDRSLGDVHPFGNPHFLLDPLNGKAVSGTIARALCAVDPGRCATYEANAKQLAATIDARLPGWQQALGGVRGTRIVTYHKNFDYLADRFGLEILGTLEPKPGIPPSPTHLAALIPRMQAVQARLILVEPYRERQTAELVAEKTGARVVVLPIMPADAGKTAYVDLIDRDVRAIAAALAQEGK